MLSLFHTREFVLFEIYYKSSFSFLYLCRISKVLAGASSSANKLISAITCSFRELEVIFYTSDNYTTTETDTFSQFAVSGFAWYFRNADDTDWVELETIAGNNKVRRKSVFQPFSTTKIRLLVTNTVDQYVRIQEVLAYGEQ